uniref:Uncharacterized protein n=1 Tax=Salix viminalis TaxID=40686 RepID=A0A6N2LZ83_SALVM
MFGGIQIGVLAACVVLFVPMGMAGYHLSRNKMLFFSGALFITLAVGVHLTPYFPSVSDFVTSVQSVNVFDNREDSCINLVNEVVWNVKPRISVVMLVIVVMILLVMTRYGIGLKWKVKVCFLDEKRMGMIMGDLFKRHSDYEIVVDEIGMKLDFVWAPYVVNLTNLMVGFKQNRTYPDVFVIGAGLWHMLHVNNASDYDIALENLRSSVVSLLPFSPELGTDGPVKVLYLLALHNSRILRSYGGPLLLLDIQSLSWNCGPRCTNDGMHYDGTVYEAAVHILLNALLIESHQKLGSTEF